MDVKVKMVRRNGCLTRLARLADNKHIATHTRAASPWQPTADAVRLRYQGDRVQICGSLLHIKGAVWVRPRRVGRPPPDTPSPWTESPFLLKAHVHAYVHNTASLMGISRCVCVRSNNRQRVEAGASPRS